MARGPRSGAGRSGAQHLMCTGTEEGGDVHAEIHRWIGWPQRSRPLQLDLIDERPDLDPKGVHPDDRRCCLAERDGRHAGV